jgi:hypothetical protein
MVCDIVALSSISLFGDSELHKRLIEVLLNTKAKCNSYYEKEEVKWQK